MPPMTTSALRDCYTDAFTMGIFIQRKSRSNMPSGISGRTSFVHVLKMVFIHSRITAVNKGDDQNKFKKSRATARSQKTKPVPISSDSIPTGTQDLSNMRNSKSQSGIVADICSPRTENNDVVVEDVRQSPVAADRNAVLKACVVTSGGLAVIGFVIRQGSHWLFQMNWLLSDCTVLMPYDFQLWHLGVTATAVVGVSMSRQLLLKNWPAFYRSSQMANYQVLKSLEPLDYVVVSALPGISEELLFRGAVLPLFGLDWKGVLLSGITFGALHLTGGRNKAFALWASFIGILYSTLSVWTADLLVPMATHSLANLAAAVIWKQNEDATSSEQQ